MHRAEYVGLMALMWVLMVLMTGILGWAFYMLLKWILP